MSLTATFRALQSPNYRLFFVGQGTSLIGTWMQRIATAWLVYRLTNSAVMLGVVGFVSQIPTFFLSPVGGVIADRLNRRNILLATQVLSLVQALVLAILVVTGTVTVVWIIVLNGCLGLINAFDVSARQSFVVEMIEKKEDLSNAIALNSSMVNGARLLGPSITGILIASAGEGLCFFINAASYLVIIAALLRMRIKPRTKPPKQAHILHDFKEGFVYIYESIPMRSTLLLLALVSLAGVPYQVLMPVFAKQILAGGPHTLGFLMGATGLGALAGAMYLASRRNGHTVWKLIPVAAALFGCGLVAFSFSRNLWLSLFVLLFTGCGMMVEMASSNTFLQVLVDDDKRGRVMAFYAMAFMGTAPLGSLIAGGLAGLIGAPHTLLVGGIVCVAGALALAGSIKRPEAPTVTPGKGAAREIEAAIESSEEVTESL